MKPSPSTDEKTGLTLDVDHRQHHVGLRIVPVWQTQQKPTPKIIKNCQLCQNWREIKKKNYKHLIDIYISHLISHCFMGEKRHLHGYNLNDIPSRGSPAAHRLPRRKSGSPESPRGSPSQRRVHLFILIVLHIGIYIYIILSYLIVYYIILY